MFKPIHWLLTQIANALSGLITLILSKFGVSPDFLASERFRGALSFFFYDTIKILLMLALIIFIISIIRDFFPPEKTRKMLGEGKGRGLMGNILAALLGIVTPFCSCSAVPLFIGFLEAGIPLGVTFSFLISSPMVNEVALVMLWGMFGWKIALIYIGSGVLVAVVSGIFIGKLKMERYVEEYVYTMHVGTANIDKPTWHERIGNAWSYMLGILKKVWLFVIIGIAIGAVLHGWVPTGWLSKYMGRENPFAVLIAVMAGIPLYSNAAGTIPVVSELTRLGIPTGTALAFMMSVTAISLPELIILRKVMKMPLLAVFVAIMAVTITIIGYFFNLILI